MISPKKRKINNKAKCVKSKSSAIDPSAQDITALMTVINQGQYELAVELAQSFTMRFPMQVVGWKVLVNMLLELGKHEDALAPMMMLTILTPEDAEAHSTLGLKLRDMGRYGEAEASCRRAVEIDPEFAESHYNLALTLFDMDRLEEAEFFFNEAIKYNSNHSGAYNGLGVISSRLSRLNSEYFKKAMAISPEYADIFSNWLFNATMSANLNSTELLTEHLLYGEQYESHLRAHWQPHKQSKDPERCLQIGFVSGDFCDHALAFFIEPLLMHLSKDSTLTLHAYYNHIQIDKITLRFQSYFSKWTSVIGLNHIVVADKIRADGIDILIDLSGHTARNLLPLFARKPAPIQASWMGYPGTTGLQAMDYYLTDKFFLPQEPFKDQFTEKLVYLTASAPFKPLSEAPEVNELPVLKNGHITFGSFNRLNKFSPEVIGVWAKLMLALPTSRLILAAIPKTGNETLIAWFAEHGIVQERLSFYPHSTMYVYLSLHHQVDMCLDTFPYNGGTTTCHALSMGVPTLTMAGQTPASRTGALILSHVGLENLIAENADDFVNKGLMLANDLELLTQLRSELRSRFSLSAAQQPDLIAKSLERALRLMWQRWCEDLPPISLDVSDTQMNTAEVLES